MKIFISLSLIILLNISVDAQVSGNNFELSVSATLGGAKGNSKTTGGYSGSYDGEMHYYFLVHGRLGYFIYKGLELEPELQLSIVENSDLMYSLNANLLFNLLKDDSKIIPFVLGGIGIGNSVPYFNTLIPFSNHTYSVHQFNAGAGLKFLLTESIAFRTEYRMQIYSYDEELNSYYGPPVKIEYSFYSHNILLGISIFF